MSFELNFAEDTHTIVAQGGEGQALGGNQKPELITL